MKVKLKTMYGSRTFEDMREKIIDCADNIIDNLDLMQDIYDKFGHDIDIHDAEQLANIVYSQIKLRM